MRRALLPIVLIFLASHPGASHEFKAGSIAIDDPWARPALRGNGAAYMTLKNEGADPDRLIAAKATIAEAAELHVTSMDSQGVMKMRPLQALEVPAKGEARLAPGGMHLMLVGLRQPLKEGGSFPLTLTFEKAGEVEVNVAVTRNPPHGEAARAVPK